MLLQVTKETTDLLEGNGGDDADDVSDALNMTAGDDGEAGDEGDDDDDGIEYVGMASNVSYLAPILRMFAMLHTFAAIAMMIGYYYLKVRFRSCLSSIGVEEGRGRGHVPTSPKLGKILFGQLLCKILAFFGQKSCRIREFC